jgi:hypothetical protein
MDYGAVDRVEALIEPENDASRTLAANRPVTPMTRNSQRPAFVLVADLPQIAAGRAIGTSGAVERAAQSRFNAEPAQTSSMSDIDQTLSLGKKLGAMQSPPSANSTTKDSPSQQSWAKRLSIT